MPSVLLMFALVFIIKVRITSTFSFQILPELEACYCIRPKPVCLLICIHPEYL